MGLCEVCSTEFVAASCYHPNQKYCSRKCTARAGHRRRRGLSVRSNDLECAVCSTKFTQKRANNVLYCSSGCKKLAASRKLKGITIKGPKLHIWGSGYITNQGYRWFRRSTRTLRGASFRAYFGDVWHLGARLMLKKLCIIKMDCNDNRLENLELWSHSHPMGSEWKIR
jgi:hypothetical protein